MMYEIEVPENYSRRALKNPHIASSLQSTTYPKSDPSVDSNGKYALKNSPDV